MSVVIGIIISVAGLIGVLYSTRFQKNEGKMKEASILQGMPLKFHYLYFLFLYLVIFLIGNLYSLTGEQYKLANAFLLAGVLCSYALTIVVLKRRY